MKIRNIREQEINVNGQSLAANSEMETEETREVKNLIKGGYVEKIKDDKQNNSKSDQGKIQGPEN